MKRIFVDCTLIDFDRQPTGIPRVVKKYLEEAWKWGSSRQIEVIPVLPTDEGLVLIPRLPPWMPKEQFMLIDKYASSSAEEADCVEHKFGLLGKRMLRGLGLQAESLAIRDRFVNGTGIRVGVGDVVFCPAYWHDVDPRIYRELKQKGVFIVTLVHDILPVLFENCYQSPWRIQFRINTIAAINYADIIFTVSKYTADAVSELAARSGVDCPPLIVAYNGFEPLTHGDHVSRKNYLANRKYRSIISDEGSPYLMVGSIEPKKAHIPVVQCFEAMWKAGFQRRLFIIGRRGWMEEPIIERIQRSVFFNKNLFWFDDLDDYELAHAYENSRGLVFASIGEGFGIPMIEAAFYQKPVIVFDTDIAREVIGPLGRYFLNARELVDHLVALESDDAHEEACRQMSAFSWPTWDKLAPVVFDRISRGYSASRGTEAR